MLVNGLNLAANQSDQRKVPMRGKIGLQKPVGGAGELQSPKPFGHVGAGRAGLLGRLQDSALEREAAPVERFNQVKRQWATRKNLLLSLAGCAHFGRRKT